MHIGVDATTRQNKRRYGRYIRALLRALLQIDSVNHYTFVTDTALEDVPDGVEMKLIKASAPTVTAAASDGRRTLRDMWQMSRGLSDPSFDLLLFPTVYSYVPVLSSARKIVIIYDVIAEKFAHLTLPSFSARMFWKAKVAMGRYQADSLVTISDYSRQQIIEYFGLSLDRVFVVDTAHDPLFHRLNQPAVTPHLQSLGFDADKPSVVYVGGFGPHKNLEQLVQVFADLAGQSDFADVQLIMVGEYKKEVFHSYFKVIQAEVKRLGLADRVIFTGFLPDDELVVLLNLASVLVLPSLMEGFGLPAIEAAACGCPVIATTASPLPQLLGQGGIFIDPARPNELHDALTQVLKSPDLRHRMGQAAAAEAAQLTWEASARQMLSVIEKVAPQ